MENEMHSDVAQAAGCSTTGCALWFLGGIALSFTATLALVLMLLLTASLALNAYLGWELAQLQITISRRATTVPPAAVIVVTATPEPLALVPVDPSVPTPEPIDTATPPPPTAAPAGIQVQEQQATVAAIATQQASQSDDSAAFVLPTPTSAAVPINPPSSDPAEEADEAATGMTSSEPAPTDPPPPPTFTATPVPAPTSPPPPAKEPELSAAEGRSRYESDNTFELIPIEGERESRPAEEHGDLNLKLRAPQSIEVDLELIDIDNAGSDPTTPEFSEVFDPEFVSAYAIHNWDWERNDKGSLIDDGEAILLGIDTEPGEPIYIPPKDQDIFQGKFYAVVLYASEDTLTFVYRRAGNVISGYTVHYLGLEVDPNLVKAFRESEGNMLPGLTLDTPVGRATDELIVAIRDNGTFLDLRSRKDWWD